MVKLHLLNMQYGQYYRQASRHIWPTKVAGIKSCLALLFIDVCTELLNNVCNVIFKQTPHFISRMRSYKFTKNSYVTSTLLDSNSLEPNLNVKPKFTVSCKC